MPRKSQPRYDATRNQWRLRYQCRSYHLCSGAGNEAEAWRKATEIMGSKLPGGPPRTVVDACAAWLAQNDGAWENSIVRPFAKWSKATPLADVHPEYLADYLKHVQRATYTRPGPIDGRPTRHRYSPSTIRRQVRYARAVLRWANVRGFLKRAVPPLPKLPKSKRVAKDIARSDLRELFGHMPNSAKRVLLFCAATGARPSEAAALKWSEIKNDRCELRRGKTWERTGKPRIIYLTAIAQQILDAQIDKRGYVFRSRLGKPYTPAGLRSIFKRAAERVGLELTGPYQLRHTWAQVALDSGEISLDELGAALGHEAGSPETKVYAEINKQRVQQAIQTLTGPVSDDLLQPTPPEKARAKPSGRGTAPKTRRKTGKARSRQAG